MSPGMPLNQRVAEHQTQIIASPRIGQDRALLFSLLVGLTDEEATPSSLGVQFHHAVTIRVSEPGDWLFLDLDQSKDRHENQES